MINIISSSRYKVNRANLKKAATDSISASSLRPDITVNLVFVGRNKMRDLANSYKKEDVALPVLTFAYPNENTGEIIICYPQAVLLAAERNRKVETMIVELIKHGVNNLTK